ncbi:MAG: class I SAM-dependent methyltransferase [Nitrospinota bacterium]
MEHSSIKRIYNGYSSVYDLLFKMFFFPRQKRAISDLNIDPGARVLDVGIGTGLTLSLYPKMCEVIGIDLSIKMLDQAKKKVKQLEMENVTLIEMDACNLAFKDNSFDYAIATHIISVVPNPMKLMNEMRRVCKPDGKLALVNHFISSNPIIGNVEKRCDPFFRKIGWRTNLSLEEFIEESKLDIYQTTKLNKIDLWKIVHLNNNKEQLLSLNKEI